MLRRADGVSYLSRPTASLGRVFARGAFRLDIAPVQSEDVEAEVVPQRPREICLNDDRKSVVPE